MRVLVLEDRPEFIGKMAEAVLAEGWENIISLTMVNTIAEADRLLAAGPWDLAFFDHDLPDGSAFSIFNRWRIELGKELPCPVWGISAVPVNNERLVERGAVGYVAKMEADAFIPKVREIVKARLAELGQLPSP